MRPLDLVSRVLSFCAGGVALALAVFYAIGPSIPASQSYFELLPAGWAFVRVIHFGILGLVETSFSLRSASAARSSILIAAGLLLLYQGVVAALNLSSLESWLFVAGVAAVAAGVLAVIEKGGVRSAVIGILGALAGFIALDLVYSPFRV